MYIREFGLLLKNMMNAAGGGMENNMDMKMRLVQIQNGISAVPEYELIVEFPADSEFSAEFLKNIRENKAWKSIEDYISQNAKDLKIRTIKILSAGVILAAIPFASSAVVVEAAKNQKYNITYVYSGTESQQIEDVKKAQKALDTVAPSYFDINSDGSLKVNTISTAFVKAMHDMNIKVVPFLSNHWDRTAGQLALKDPEGLAAKLADLIQKNNLDGINVDLENLTEKDRDAQTALVTALRKKIPSNKEVSVAVAANPNNWQTGWHGSYDYSKLAANSDYLMMMTYDEHWEGSDPGPVASIQFVENSIKYALSKTSKNKIVVGLPFYGRIWSNDGTIKGKGITLNQIESMISDYKATVTYDTVSQSPKAVFTIKSGDKTHTVGGRILAAGTYTVWYENEKSLAAKSDLIYKYDVLGIGSWALGQATDKIKGEMLTWVGGANQTTPPAANQSVSPQTGYVTASALNVRKNAGTNAAITTTISKGQSVTLLSSVVNGWYQVKLSNGVTGYVSAQYITLTKPASQPSAQPSSPSQTSSQSSSSQTGKVTASVLNVRKSAGTNAAVITKIAKGQSVTLLSSAVNGWYQVRLANGTVGYVSAQYITMTSSSSQPSSQTLSRTGKVTASVLNVRQSAGTNGKIISTLKKGQSVTLLSNAVNGWYQVKLTNGAVGYVSAQYIKV